MPSPSPSPLLPRGLTGAQWWHELPDGRLACDLCPRDCRLREGQRGLCFVRARQGNQMVLTTYGRSSGLAIDPVEKKPLHHFLPGTTILSFGTAGCNLTCRFCQNWNISKSRDLATSSVSAMPEDIARTAADLACASVAFTYNDPVIFAEYAMDTADAARARGLRAVAVTAGYINARPRREFFQHMDAANVDLKAFSETFYAQMCGAHLAPVLDTLLYLRHETTVWLEITTLLIPGANDTNAELESMTHWLADNLGPDVPLHFSAFHPAYHYRAAPATPVATLARARAIAQQNGLRYVYTGNVPDDAGRDTSCPQCGARLITRRGYGVQSYRLTENGVCPDCATAIPGVWAASTIRPAAEVPAGDA